MKLHPIIYFSGIYFCVYIFSIFKIILKCQIPKNISNQVLHSITIPISSNVTNKTFD